MKLKPVDILKFEAVGDQQYCPNDESFVFVRRIYEEGKALTAIFKKTLENQEEKLTDYSENASKPRFSTDGKYLAFIKKVNDKNTLAVMDYQSRQIIILESEQDVRGVPVWSPKGNYIAFLKNIEILEDSYKGSPKEINDNLKYEDKQIKVITDIKYRFNETGYFGNKKSQLFVAELKGHSFVKTERMTGINFNVSNPVFSQDEKTVYYLANPYVEGERNSITNIYSINLESKQTDVKVKGRGPISSLQVSPSGNSLSFLAQDKNDKSLWFNNLYVYDIGDEKDLLENKNITKHLDRVIGKAPSSGERFPSSLPVYQWKNNDEGFYLIYPEKGTTVLAEMDLSSNSNVIYHNENKTISSFAVKNNSYLLTIGSIEKPEQIYQYNKSLDLVVASNVWIKDYQLGKGTRYKFNGDGSLEIDGWYVQPKDVEGPNKTILFIHGGPHGIYGSSFMFQVQVLISTGFTVAYVNPRGSASYGTDFANMVYEDWGGADFRDIMAGVDYLIENNISDKNKLGITGWSYGGYMTCWGISQTNRFKAAVAGASVVDRYSMFGTSDIGYDFGYYHFGGTPWQNAHKVIERSPLNYAYRIETPLLMVHGEEDFRCPIGQSEEIFTALKFLNKEVVLVRYPDEPHNFKKPYHLVDRYQRLQAWFDYYIK